MDEYGYSSMSSNTHNEVLQLKKEGNFYTCYNMNEP